MHHGQEGPHWPPPVQRSELIWRETWSRLTDRDGETRELLSRHLLRVHGEIKVNFALPRWNNSVDEKKLNSVISVLGTLLRSQNIDQCYQERNVSAPGE